MYSLPAVPLLLLRLCLQVCLGLRPTDGRNADTVLIILLRAAAGALNQRWAMSCSSAEGGGSQGLTVHSDRDTSTTACRSHLQSLSSSNVCCTSEQWMSSLLPRASQGGDDDESCLQYVPLLEERNPAVKDPQPEWKPADSPRPWTSLWGSGASSMSRDPTSAQMCRLLQHMR